mmetsp:Transcript_18403/g.18492  ORF Transcript_18403/g.18492 Transcript_18403/m.18492 type:complete len:406 (+) Transcript_18403:210-1427(+)
MKKVIICKTIFKKQIICSLFLKLLCLCIFIVFCESVENNLTVLPTCEELTGIDENMKCTNRQYTPGVCCATKNKWNRLHGLRCMPKLVIAGSQKGGTTELGRLIVTHPDIVYTKSEIHFFDHSPENLPCKALSYILQFALHDQLEAVFANTTSVVFQDYKTRYVIDKTPEYMLHELPIKELHDMLPTVPIVITLRHPTPRVFSGFRTMCNGFPGLYQRVVGVSEDRFAGVINATVRGKLHSSYFTTEPVTSCDSEAFHHYLFSSAAKLYTKLFTRNVSPDHKVGNVSSTGYADLCYGFYDEQIEHLLRYFPSNQILIVFQEEWKRDVPSVLRQMESHADLSHHNFSFIPATGSNGAQHSPHDVEEDNLNLDRYYAHSISRLDALLKTHFSRGIPEEWRTRLPQNL